MDIVVEESDDNDETLYPTNIPLPIKKIYSLTISFLLSFRILYNISDHAVVMLLRFLKHLFFAIGTAFGIPELKQEEHFPKSIHGCYSFINLDATPYKQYVVCPSCHLLYDQNTQQLTIGTSRNPESSKCSFIEFPNHPQLRFRKKCDTILLNKVLKRNNIIFKPRKIYYYFGIKRALPILLNRPNFLNACNAWLRNQEPKDFLADITDGRVWKELVSALSIEENAINILGLLINVDWFQPYKHVSYSVGVIYAVVTNLPRCLRYKNENVIIIGIIPGPHEPKLHINSYLGPLVSELLELKSGQWFITSMGRQFVKCVVVCLSSDIPATRKAAGFVGHNALKACSRCLKSFPRVGDHTDCSGFERSSWPVRNHAIHCEKALNALEARTKVARKVIETEFGARYSLLYELPYYDAIRFPVIDIMHNLFLGTAKNLMTIWKDNGLLKKEDFDMIQQKIETLQVPSDVGRIPYKIESGMAGLTADQWKNWTCVYSMYALQGVLATEHLNCWWLFVQACILICQPLISQERINRADQIMLEFCQVYENLYGNLACTINLHLHCHIAECLRDYGPAHSTWCFSFERYNGVLGGMPTNNRSLQIEKTMITRFVQQMISHHSFPPELQPLFETTTVGSVSDSQMSSDTYIKLFKYSTTTNFSELLRNYDLCSPIGQVFQHALESQEVHFLTKMYEAIFPDCSILGLSCLCYRFSRSTQGGKLISSQMAKSDRSSYIGAYWHYNGAISTEYWQPGRVKFFFRHNIVIKKQNGDTESFQSLFAYVEWYKPHPEKAYIPSPVSIWYPEFEPLSAASFIPLPRIACRCAQADVYMEFADRPHNSGQVIIIVPLNFMHI